MTPTQAKNLKARIDAALPTIPHVKGILFGAIAFDFFLQNGWIVRKKLVGILPPHLEFDAYFYQQHFAHETNALPQDVAQII